MKKRSQSRSTHIRPVQIYLEGLEEIVRVIGGTCQNIEIKTNEYEFDCLDEFKDQYKKHSELQELEIDGKEPYISVSFGYGRVHLYAGSDDAISDGMYLRIREILKNNKPKLHFLRSGWLLFSYFIFMQPFVWAGSFLLDATYVLITTSILFLIGIVFFTLWLYGQRDRYNCLIVLKHKIEQKNFFPAIKIICWFRF